MKPFLYHSNDYYYAGEPRFSLLCRYRGALWGMLGGAPIGLATMLNLSMQDPAAVVGGVLVLWLAGGLCGHNMQLLLEETR